MPLMRSHAGLSFQTIPSRRCFSVSSRLCPAIFLCLESRWHRAVGIADQPLNFLKFLPPIPAFAATNESVLPVTGGRHPTSAQQGACKLSNPAVAILPRKTISPSDISAGGVVSQAERPYTVSQFEVSSTALAVDRQRLQEAKHQRVHSEQQRALPNGRELARFD